MKIKRFLAKNNQEAMMKVKLELGPDAVIIHQRKVKPKGLLGFFKKPLIEIVAAREDKVLVSPQPGIPSRTDSSSKRDPAAATGHSSVEDEIRSIRSLLNRLIDEQGSGEEPALPVKETLLNKLFEKNDIDQQVIQQMMGSCKDLENKSDFSHDLPEEERIRQIMGACIRQHVKIQSGKPGKRVVVFVGPTGVGKTTTIAKLAARATLNEGKNVGLVSADTYRIAAVEQLRTYSDILNIPLKVVYQPAEMREALEQLKTNDIIMIDTAGRSHRDVQQINELKELINHIPEKDVFLLLSCTTRHQDIRDILNRYDFLDDYKIIVTKIDEASAFGTLVNVPVLTDKPVSYMTTGQSVPDDIEAVTVDKILNLMIKETL